MVDLEEGNTLVTSQEFRQATGKFPTGVTIITTSYHNRLWGFTANSFTSVSLNPQLVSFCLYNQASSFKAFTESKYFAVSILANDQQALSIKFSNQTQNKFDSVQYTLGDYSKSPLLSGAISCIECKKYNLFDCGDHCIFIGRVQQVFINKFKSPLVYYTKSYTDLKK